METNLVKIEKALTPFIAEVLSLKITDEESKNKAVEFLGQLKVRWKRADFLRKEELEPHAAEVKRINNGYKVWLERLEKAEAIMKKGLIDYTDEQQRLAAIEAERIRKENEEKERAEQARLAAIKAEEERLRKEAEKATSEEQKAQLQWEADNKQDEAAKAEMEMVPVEPPVILAPETTTRTHSGVFSVKKVWRWEVENEELLRKAHPELFILDEKAVNKLVQSGEREIAGIRIFQESQAAMKV